MEPVQEPGTALDVCEYIEVIADPEFDDQPQLVCTEMYYVYTVLLPTVSNLLTESRRKRSKYVFNYSIVASV